MTHLIRALALTPLVLLICSTAQSADEKMLTSSYFPLAVGTKWQYRIGETRYTVEVKAHEKIGGMMAAKLEMYTTTKDKPVSHEHVAVTGDGIVRVAFEGKLLEKPVMFLKLKNGVPLGKNDEPWKVDSVLVGSDKKQTIRGVFKPGAEDAKVPLGNYQAVTVTGQDLEVAGTKLTLTYYFADKVGMVKQTMDLAGQKIVVELEKFEAGK